MVGILFSFFIISRVEPPKLMTLNWGHLATSTIFIVKAKGLDWHLMGRGRGYY